MSSGDIFAGIGQGLNALAGQNLARKKAQQEQEQALEMFNFKQAAELDQLQKMEALKYDLANKRRDNVLSSLEKKFRGTQTPTNLGLLAQNPSVQPAPTQAPQPPTSPGLLAQNPSVQPPQNPQQAQTIPMFNSQAWESEHYQDYVNPDSDSGDYFDVKGFRQGLKNAENEYQNQQYLKSQNIDLPISMLNSPFASDIIKQRGEETKIKDKTQGNKIAQKILTDPGYRTGKKQLTDSDLEALAKGGIDIASLYKADGSIDFGNATQAARIIAANTPKVGRGGGGGRGRSGGGGASGGRASGGGGYKQTRDGNFVKVDKRGNPTGQIINARDAYNIGITNTPPAPRRPRAVQGGGGTAEAIRQQINSIKGFD